MLWMLPGCGSGSGSTPITTAPTAPVISTQPSNQTVASPQTATFTVAATGTAPLNYQWQKGGANISGATAVSYTTPATTAADNGSQFTVAVSNSAGTVSSKAATLTVNSPPTITGQPSNQSAVVGQTATFTVVASGTSPFSYQWQKGGVNISGATSASYVTPATLSSDNGSQFDAMVSNAFGSATSTSATLTVTTTAPLVDVVTYHYDNSRSGANVQETILTPANVNSTTFGKLGLYPVDGLVDGQPLYLSQLSVNGSMHNALYVVTRARQRVCLRCR